MKVRDDDYDHNAVRMHMRYGSKIPNSKGVKTMVNPKPKTIAPKPKPSANGGGISFLNAKNITAPWIQIFVLGDPGSGKTQLASTFPRPVFLQPKNEQSMLTLQGLDIEYIEIDSMRGPVVNGVGGMLTAVRGLESMYLKDPSAFPFDTIVIEQVGHYGDIIQRELTNGTQQMDQQKWGLFLNHLLEIQAILRNMQVHIVWTSHTKVEKINDTTTICGANISGQAATKIPSSCDIIAYCESGSGVTPRFRTHFRRYNGFNARSRFPLPSQITNCTFNAIAEYLDGAPIVETEEEVEGAR